MLVVVKDKDGNEVATHIDVDKITIDTSVSTGLTFEVYDDSDSIPPAYSVITAIALKDIIPAQQRPTK